MRETDRKSSFRTRLAFDIDWTAFEYYRRLSRLKHYVDEHYSERIRLSDAAGVVALERTYFSKFFHSKTGVCFKDWLALERITHAIELIDRRNFTIPGVATRVGYTDLRTFERAFKRYVGITPREYRRSVRHGHLSPREKASA